ncbi:MAG: hypothetical protein INR69_14970 [Mucilaginibacter polytrichastri]|nr:hypothetical protein [Mucilaginibacter polytrichastri]
MKKIQLFAPLLLIITLLSSCDLIGGIFKAGVWVGVLSVVVVVVLIIWIIVRLFGGSGK